MSLTHIVAARREGEPDGQGFTVGARRVLDARLERNVSAPVAVALSGGGDSLALLLLARAWAKAAGRGLIALTVDHRLQPASTDWAGWCARRAARLGVDHRILTWEGPKPASGVASAARDARHRLIAEATRAAGGRVILMGHTADDVMEAALMRRAGGQVSAPRAWSPSPVWPGGRGLFILRPLLDARRAAIRAWLSTAGETWIDDPANDDLRLPRARARSLLAADGLPVLPNSQMAGLSALLGAIQIGAAGEAIMKRAALTETPGADRFLAAAIVSVAGTQRPPRGSAVQRLMVRLNRADDAFATLAGARIAARGSNLTIVRETSDRRKRPAPRLALEPGRTEVYDGRFEVSARDGDLVLRPLAGLASHLDGENRRRLAPVAPSARPSLPALVDGAGRVTCPTLIADPRVRLRCLAPARLAGACGAVSREREIDDA